MSSRSLTGTHWLRALLAGMAIAGCGDDAPAGPGRRVYAVEVTGERFHVALERPEQIAQAEALLAAGRDVVVHGTLAHGDGGFNGPYRWHLVPGTVSFPDLAMEVCSGRPRSDVEADPAYWVDHLGLYCPWGARIVARASR
jgi:hypothetical protein